MIGSRALTMTSPKFWLILLRFIGLGFICAMIYWGLQDENLTNEGLIYGLGYLALIGGILVAFYIPVIAGLYLYKIWHDWRYPDFDRELGQSEILYIETRQSELKSYVESRNFASKKYWLTGWAILALLLLGVFIITKLFFFLEDHFYAMPDHEVFGQLISFQGKFWTFLLVILTVITGATILCVVFAAIVSYLFRPFAEATTISLSWAEQSLADKAEELPETVETYFRYRFLDMNDELGGRDMLDFIGRRRRFSLLKWGLGLCLLGIPLFFLSLQNGTGFYEKGLSQRSLLTLSKTDIAYTDIDYVGVACLYNDAENKAKKRSWLFYKDGHVIAETWVPRQKDEDFEKLNDYLIGIDIPFRKNLFTFDNPIKRVKNPFEHCIANLVMNNPEDRNWIRTIMHLDDFEGQE